MAQAKANLFLLGFFAGSKSPRVLLSTTGLLETATFSAPNPAIFVQLDKESETNCAYSIRDSSSHESLRFAMQRRLLLRCRVCLNRPKLHKGYIMVDHTIPTLSPFYFHNFNFHIPYGRKIMCKLYYYFGLLDALCHSCFPFPK